MTVTAARFQVRASITPIVSVPLSQTCCTASETSSDVLVSASSAYSPKPCKPSAARTWKWAIRTDSGMLGKTNAINCGPGSTAVSAMVLCPFLPACWQRARSGHATGSHRRADGKHGAVLAN